MSEIKFTPKMQVETADGVGVVKYTKTKAPDYREIESVCVETDGKEAFFSPDSVKVLDVEEPAPETKREPKKAKTVKLNIAFQKADGSLLPKSEFLALMAVEYDRLAEELGIGNFEDIETAVLAAFTELKGASLNLKYLHSCTVKALKPEGVEAWTKLSKQLKTYFDVKTGPKESGAMFGVKPGRNGGHFVWADCKEA